MIQVMLADGSTFLCDEASPLVGGALDCRDHDPQQTTFNAECSFITYAYKNQLTLAHGTWLAYRPVKTQIVGY